MGPRVEIRRGITKGARSGSHCLLKHQTTRAAGWYARSADDAIKPTASGSVSGAPSVAHPALPASQAEPAALIPLKLVWDEQWQQWRCYSVPPPDAPVVCSCCTGLPPSRGAAPSRSASTASCRRMAGDPACHVQSALPVDTAAAAEATEESDGPPTQCATPTGRRNGRPLDDDDARWPRDLSVSLWCDDVLQPVLCDVSRQWSHVSLDVA